MAGVATVVYVGLTYALLKRTKQSNGANLRQSLMTQYDALRPDIEFIRYWYMESSAGGVDPLSVLRTR